jgi:uncharacterized protein
MRIVLDANVWVSALISRNGAPAEIVERWRQGMVEVVVSAAILAEVDRVLHYPKLRDRYRLAEIDVETFLHLLANQALHVEPSEELSVVACDPTDNRYVECAVVGEAAAIVSGDRHLLALTEYQGIQMVTPAGFLVWLETDG